MKNNPFSRFAPLLVFGALAFAPALVGDFQLSLLGRFLALAIVAIGIDLIWGYTGILSLGHAVYFGLGAYCTAMFLKLEATKGALPDFMGWSGVETLPFWWKPFENGPFALLMAIVVPMLLASLLGFFTFRNRIKGVFFSILSQALAIITVTFFVGQQAYTGGTNGITDFSTGFGYTLSDSSTKTALYFLSLGALTLSFFGAKWLVSGKFGRILLAIRDGENRLRFTGYDPTSYKVFIYALSAGLAGLAGALFVPQIGIISPSSMGIVPSIGMVLWVAIGGRGTISGAVLGAIAVNALEFTLSVNYPEIWQFLIGATFVLVVLFMPRGVMGLFADIGQKTRAMRAPKISGAEASAA